MKNYHALLHAWFYEYNYHKYIVPQNIYYLRYLDSPMLLH